MKKLMLPRRVKIFIVGMSALYSFVGISNVFYNAGIIGNKAINSQTTYTETQQSSEDYETFTWYDIPESYSQSGGLLPKELQKYIYNVCQEYGVEYSLVLAVIEAESGYRYNAESPCGAKGYMQIVPKWHYDRMERLDVEDITCPPYNILVGVDYLSELMDEYPTELALSIYNRGFHNESGTGAIDLWDKGITSTSYSANVLEIKKRIDGEMMAND